MHRLLRKQLQKAQQRVFQTEGATARRKQDYLASQGPDGQVRKTHMILYFCSPTYLLVT